MARTPAFLALLVSLPAVASACTYFEVESPGGVWVAGRTMELGGGGGGLFRAARSQGSWRAALHPRGADPSGLENRYGYVSIDAYMSGDPKTADPAGTVISDGMKEAGLLISDGMNEAGLSVSLHTMRMARYQEPDPAKASLLFLSVVPYLLGHFDCVDAARQGLANVSVTAGSYGPGDFVHWAVADAHGKSAVFEYVDGTLQVHSNDVRVMTNDPDYQWHVKNLNMYVGLSPGVPNANAGLEVATEVGPVPKVWSQGFNLNGLPGDLSPASRFVRVFYLRRYAETREPVQSVDDAIVLATGLLNNVFIPRGSVAPMQPPTSALDYDFTQYGLLKIPAQRRLLFRTYRSMAWKEIDLKSLAWDTSKSMPLSDGTLDIEDVTGKMRGMGEELV
mmetsp:Transcript_20197/g.63452  ORF Transcript_20197/g.63452 Transcript_20197/m.63452 type:complete len:392 (+) Transcript_20197:1-1176(+)